MIKEKQPPRFSYRIYSFQIRKLKMFQSKISQLPFIFKDIVLVNSNFGINKGIWFCKCGNIFSILYSKRISKQHRHLCLHPLKFNINIWRLQIDYLNRASPSLFKKLIGPDGSFWCGQTQWFLLLEVTLIAAECCSWTQKECNDILFQTSFWIFHVQKWVVMLLWN